MTPLRFEALHQAEWAELESLLDRVRGRRADPGEPASLVPGERVALLYRRACGHLALARARSYPAHLLDRLERVTADAHQVIYRRHDLGLARLRQGLLRDFPRAVRLHAPYVWVAAVTFLAPALALGGLVYWRPELILSVVDVGTAASFESMYAREAESIGRARDAGTDWLMFGFYIRNNISVAFQCFAGGLFAGLGSLFFLAYNGALLGAVAGYLTERGLATTFYSFVSTHGSFELTAAVLSGAAGLRIGHALLTPGRLSRLQSLVIAARESMIIVYGVVGMLVVAAAIEAFWSSAGWVPPSVKFAVAAVCWTAVLGYFAVQGRRAD